MIARIAHTTDFSADSGIAFQHALRIAVATRARLDILHVRDPDSPAAWDSFPRVREPLAAWRMIDPAATPDEVEARLGVHVAKVEIGHHDPLSGIATFLTDHRPDLLVLATHGRGGVNRWLHGSVTEELMARTRVPSLVVGPKGIGFVNHATGAIELPRILMPVVPHPNPTPALHALCRLLAPLGVTSANIELLTIGGDIPVVRDPDGMPMEVEHLTGPVIDTILQEADDQNVQLIAMPTTGRSGLLDAFRGSTASRVLARAPCPVLVLPISAAA